MNKFLIILLLVLAFSMFSARADIIASLTNTAGFDEVGKICDTRNESTSILTTDAVTVTEVQFEFKDRLAGLGVGDNLSLEIWSANSSGHPQSRLYTFPTEVAGEAVADHPSYSAHNFSGSYALSANTNYAYVIVSEQNDGCGSQWFSEKISTSDGSYVNGTLQYITDGVAGWTRPGQDMLFITYGTTGGGAPDETAPIIDISSYNVTSSGTTNSTAWQTARSGAVKVTDPTPTVTFTTDENSNASIGLVDQNYTTMLQTNGDSECSTTSTTSHTCTIPASLNIVPHGDYIYISVIDTSFNENATSSSGALWIDLNRNPSLNVVAPASGTYTPNTTVQFEWSTTEQDGDYLNHTFYVSYNSTSSFSIVNTSINQDSNHTEFHTLGSLVNGSVVFWKIMVQDGYGGFANSSIGNLTINITPPPPATPNTPWASSLLISPPNVTSTETVNGYAVYNLNASNTTGIMQFDWYVNNSIFSSSNASGLSNQSNSTQTGGPFPAHSTVYFKATPFLGSLKGEAIQSSSITIDDSTNNNFSFTFSPADTNFTVHRPDRITFSVTLSDADNDVLVNWTVDGALVQEGGTSFVFRSNEYIYGAEYEVKATMADGAINHQQSQVWSVQVGERENLFLVMLAAIAVVSGIFLAFAFKLDKDHFPLKLLLIFFSLITLMLAPSTLINGVVETQGLLMKLVVGFFLVFTIYFVVYLFYHWSKKSEKFARWLQKMK